MRLTLGPKLTKSRVPPNEPAWCCHIPNQEKRSAGLELEWTLLKNQLSPLAGDDDSRSDFKWLEEPFKASTRRHRATGSALEPRLESVMINSCLQYIILGVDVLPFIAEEFLTEETAISRLALQRELDAGSGADSCAGHTPDRPDNSCPP